jgi:hypothetical protein
MSSHEFLRLRTAGTRAMSLGVAALDSQTRFTSVNASLARESCTIVDNYLGKTSREVMVTLPAGLS